MIKNKTGFFLNLMLFMCSSLNAYENYDKEHLFNVAVSSFLMGASFIVMVVIVVNGKYGHLSKT